MTQLIEELKGLKNDIMEIQGILTRFFIRQGITTNDNKAYRELYISIKNQLSRFLRERYSISRPKFLFIS
jgi:hypothetical protein